MNTTPVKAATPRPAPQRTATPAPASPRADAPKPAAQKADTFRNLFVLEVAVFFAILCAEMAGFLLLGVVERYLDALESWHAHETSVAVAAHRIGVGDTITAADLRVVPYPKDFIPSGALTEPAQSVGRVAHEPILAGEMVRPERLTDPDRGQGLDALLPTGMRAASLILDGSARVAGQVEPGDRVDVIATLFEKLRPTTTQTVLQGVEVLAVEQHVDHTRTLSQREWSQVTFAVTPDEAERLTQATRVGRVQLAMRSPVDFEERTDLPGTTTDSLVATP